MNHATPTAITSALPQAAPAAPEMLQPVTIPATRRIAEIKRTLSIDDPSGWLVAGYSGLCAHMAAITSAGRGRDCAPFRQKGQLRELWLRSGPPAIGVPSMPASAVARRRRTSTSRQSARGHTRWPSRRLDPTCSGRRSHSEGAERRSPRRQPSRATGTRPETPRASRGYPSPRREAPGERPRSRSSSSQRNIAFGLTKG